MLIRPFVRLLAGEDALTRLERFLSGQELREKIPTIPAERELTTTEAGLG